MAATHTLARARSTGSLRELIARRPMLSYFVIAFVPVWLGLLPPVLAQNGLGLLPFTVSDMAFVLLFIGGTLLGPTAGAFIVTSATEGRAGVRRFLRRYVQWRVGIQWYAITLFGTIALYLVAASLWLGVGPLASLAANWTVLLTSYPVLLLAMILFPALIEEPGWRGFALPRLQAAYGPLAGTLLLGFLHGIWHLPVYMLVSGPAAMGPFDIAFLASNTASIMLMTIVWTWVFNNARGSILIGILLHAASNATDKVFLDLVPTVPPQMSTTVFALYAVAAALVVVFTRGRLGYRPERLEQ